MAVDWNDLERRTREQFAAEGLDEDCLPIAKPGDEPGEPLTMEILEKMFAQDEQYLALVAENEKD